MPTALRIGSYRFHFYSDEGDEPAHVHVAFGSGEAKFWLGPPVNFARAKDLSSVRIRKIERLVRENCKSLKEAYDEFHL